eukprot:GILJ01003926.1.p1 GENE.GILJ01003926.1~~GILJ01003926.1.p1  ORF type:complete len:367 (+),score=55.12 GILJ01003926.1:36-1103(+)
MSLSNANCSGSENWPAGYAEHVHLCVPSDANTSGNVHGGTTLRLIEFTGWLCATRHSRARCVTANLDNMDFHTPMYLNELAFFQAQLTFVSERSMEVKVEVYAESLTDSTRRHTNTAYLTYCALGDGGRVLSVPPFVPESDSAKLEFEEGRKRHELRKKSRSRGETAQLPTTFQVDVSATEQGRTVKETRSTIVTPMMHTDANTNGYIHGGVVMKMMDTLAAIVAYRHCRTNVITARVDSMEIYGAVKVGDICRIKAIATFASTGSLEVYVETFSESVQAKKKVVSAYFIFVALDADRKPTRVPKLQIQTIEEGRRFEQGRLRYEQRRREKKQKQTQDGLKNLNAGGTAKHISKL